MSVRETGVGNRGRGRQCSFMSEKVSRKQRERETVRERELKRRKTW